MRHGLSRNGNDHIHIAASRVREDGTKVSIHMDYVRAQSVARELEQQHGLRMLEGEREQTATRGWKLAEREAARRRGQPEPARSSLCRTVRACAIAAGGEAEFVRRLRAEGVLVRPRSASDRTDVVTGYSVALRPERGSGERPIWYGGLRLARDLTLPALRQGWPDSPASASAAVAEWNAADRHRRSSKAGAERQEFGPRSWSAQTDRLRTINDRIAEVPIGDRDTWAQVSRETAGALAAWSRRAHPEVAGDLAAASDALSRSAQLRRKPMRAPRDASWVGGVALMAASLTHAGRGLTAQIALMDQVIRLVGAIAAMHAAVGEARRAADVRRDVEARLQRVSQRWEGGVPRAAGGAPQRVQGEVLAASTEAVRRGPGFPIPTRLEAPRKASPAHADRDRGTER